MSKLERIPSPHFPCFDIKRGETNEECEPCPCGDDKSKSIVDGIRCPWSIPVDDPHRDLAYTEWKAYQSAQKLQDGNAT